MTATHQHSDDPRWVFLRLAAVSAAAAGAFGLLGAALALAIPALGDVRTALTATLIALLGSVVSSAAPAWAVRRPSQVLAAAMLASLGIRFAATLAAALVVRAATALPGDALLIWVAVAQLALLAADVAAQVRLTRNVGTVARC